jgi:hypothetical protein
MSATHASLDVHLWICPQARHRKGTRTSGRVSRTTISVVRPVGTGRFVCGHLITMSLTVTLQQEIGALTKMTAITFFCAIGQLREICFCRNSMEPSKTLLSIEALCRKLGHRRLAASAPPLDTSETLFLRATAVPWRPVLF